MKTIRRRGARSKGERLAPTDDDIVKFVGDLMKVDTTDPLSLAKLRLDHLWADFGDEWTEEPAALGRLGIAQRLIWLVGRAFLSERRDLWQALSAALVTATNPKHGKIQVRRGHVLAIVEQGLAEYYADVAVDTGTKHQSWMDLPPSPVATTVKSPKIRRQIAVASTINSAALWDPAFEKLADRLEFVEDFFVRADPMTPRPIGAPYVAAALSLEANAFGDEKVSAKTETACRRLARTFQSARNELEKTQSKERAARKEQLEKTQSKELAQAARLLGEALSRGTK